MNCQYRVAVARTSEKGLTANINTEYLFACSLSIEAVSNFVNCSFECQAVECKCDLRKMLQYDTAV